MKTNKFNRFLFALAIAAVVVGCTSDDESPSGSGIDFETLATTADETGGSVTIPLRNGTVSASAIVLGGTAVEGEDYEVTGVTSEGVQISIIDDNEFEPDETIRLQIPTTGNNIHTITIKSNCGDTENPYLKYFAGTWDATEKYGPEPGDWYGPYHVEFTQDEEEPTEFHLDNFYDAGRAAYLVFDVAAGTVHFPDQQPTPDPGSPTLLTGSSGTFVIDECNGATTLTITLNYDGGEWEYSFVKL